MSGDDAIVEEKYISVNVYTCINSPQKQKYRKNHVTMQKVVEHFQSKWSASCSAGHTASFMEVVPPPKNVFLICFKKHSVKRETICFKSEHTRN